MKKLLVSSAVVALLSAGAASAEVAFEKGTIGVDLGFIDGEDVTLFDVDARIAFTTGSFGFQIDSGMMGITDFSDMESFGTFGLHFYKNTANGAKFGAYLANTYFINQVGVEAIVPFGALDIEASLGMLGEDFGSSDLYQATFDVFYGVSENIELNAGVDHLFDDSDSVTIYRVNGTYMIPNSDVAVTVGYEDIDGESIINAGVSWSFGPNQDTRLFGDRGFDFLFGF